MGYSVQTKDFHYIQWFKWNNKTKETGDSVAAELYDHRVDPYETVNQIGNLTYQATVSNMIELMGSNWSN